MTILDRIDSLLADIGRDEVKANGQLSSLKTLLQRYMKEDPDGWKRSGTLSFMENQLADLYHDYSETMVSLTAKWNKLENLMKQALDKD